MSLPKDHLIEPHGGALIDLVVSPAQAAELRSGSREWPSWDLTQRQICDLELLLNGGFSPLTGFMSRPDYESVRDHMRLADGTLWTMLITLDVDEKTAAGLSAGDRLALRDQEGVMLAGLVVEDVWEPDRGLEAERVLGTRSAEHPGVAYLMEHSHPAYVGGRLEGVQPPLHYDFKDLRRTPAELREEFAKLGWRKVVAFQTRNPMHRAHQELTLRASREA